MNNLRNARCYLAGAIEKAVDCGATWRNTLKRRLVDVGITWMDPCDKPIVEYQEDPALHELLRTYRQLGGVRELKDAVKPIRRIDLRMVDVSDFIIVGLDPDTPTFGTHEEICRANQQNKPVIVYIHEGLRKMPFWWYDMIDTLGVFGSLEEVEEHIRAIDSITDRSGFMRHTDYKWIFFDWMRPYEE